MDTTREKAGPELVRLVKIGLIRELFRQRRITQSQFEQLMKLYRA